MAHPDPGAAADGGGEHQDDEAARITSLTELHARQDRLESKLDQILGLLGPGKPAAAAGPPSTAAAADQPPATIADQIRAQLEDRDRRDREAAAGKDAADRLAAVEQTVTGLAERIPESPVRKVEQRMGWR